MYNDPTYMRYVEKSHSQRQKEEGGCQGMEGDENGELLFNGYIVSVLQNEVFWRWAHTSVNVLTVTVLHT